MGSEDVHDYEDEEQSGNIESKDIVTQNIIIGQMKLDIVNSVTQNR